MSTTDTTEATGTTDTTADRLLTIPDVIARRPVPDHHDWCTVAMRSEPLPQDFPAS